MRPLTSTPRFLAVPALTLAVGLVGCGQTGTSGADDGAQSTATASPTPSPSPTPSIPAGWERYEQEDANFAVALPETWVPLDPARLNDSDAFNEMIEQNPQIAELLGSVAGQLESGQIAFFGFDRESGPGFATNLNVIPAGPTNLSADELAEQGAANVEQTIPVEGEIEQEQVTLPAGESARLRYRWTLNNPAGTAIPVAVTQYLLVVDGESFVLSFSTTTSELASYEDTFTGIAESFELVEE